VNRKPAAILLVLSIAVLALALVPAAGLAAKGAGGGGKPGGGGGGKPGGGSCVRSAPAVTIDNNYGWSQWGSWGLPGQQLTYLVKVINYDVGCGSSTFGVSVTAPAGFVVSPASTTVSVASGSSSAYLSVYVTSPTSAADGNYPVMATVTRQGDASPSSSFASSYMVYSTDTSAPTLFWENPGEGNVISGRSYNVTVSSSDDHAVRKIELWMDGAYVTTTTCDNVTYICQLYDTWSVGASGQHTATFVSTDWKGNVGTKTVTFTVG